MNTDNLRPIAFPALIRMGRSLVPAGLDFMALSGANREAGDMFSVKELLNADFHWVIDANGCLLSFQRIDSYRKTPRFIKKFINFERVRYSISPSKKLSFDDLKTLIVGTNGGIRREISKVCEKHEPSDTLYGDVFLAEIMGEKGDVEIDYF